MWDCKYKVGKDQCRLRKVKCYPGGKKCVLKGKYQFPLRKENDELDRPPKKPTKKKLRARTKKARS